MQGNNSNIIRRAFEGRLDYWKEVPCFNSSFHFKWQPFSKGIYFDQLSISQRQMVNHFECHEEITTKNLLFKNLLEYTEKSKLNIYDYVPLTFILNLKSETETVDYEKFVSCYNILAADSQSLDFKQMNKKLQSINLSQSRKMYTMCKLKLKETHYIGRNLWILKPTGLNRGRGVSVFDTLDKFKALLKEYSEGVIEEDIPKIVSTNVDAGMSNLGNLPCIIKANSFVIQKYLERPMLIHNRKFDIRCWVLLTEDMKLYFFKEGYIRTSASEYTIDQSSVEKKNVHLTNNAIQKSCPDYGKFEDGNQLSFPMFQVPSPIFLGISR